MELLWFATGLVNCLILWRIDLSGPPAPVYWVKGKELPALMLHTLAGPCLLFCLAIAVYCRKRKI